MKPHLIVVMGVSGCGKSTVAKALADEFSYQFVEADDFHPDENVAHMASGLPLTDEMRKPWLALLGAHLKQSARSGQNLVMSFSGLRRQHRARIRDLPFEVLFIHLKGAQTVILERMNARKGHFMPPTLLASQYQALENPAGEKNTVEINVDQSLAMVISDAKKMANHGFETSH